MSLAGGLMAVRCTTSRRTRSSWPWRLVRVRSFGAPTELFQVRVAGGVSSQRTHYVPSRDGRRFLINTPTGDAAMVPITVVLNWTAALKK